MQKILLVASSLSVTSTLFKQVQLFFDTNLRAIDEVTADDLRNCSLIVVDFAVGDGDHLTAFKKQLREFPHVPRGGMISLSNRKEIVQAKALGLVHLWDRAGDIAHVISAIRGLVGNYSVAEMSPDTPAATRTAVNSLCSTLDEVAVAAISGTPMPMKSAARSVHVLMSALQQDGIDAWLAAVQSHHSHTFCHSMMVTGFAVAFGQALRLDPNQCAVLSLGALIHDLGKVRIPLAILDKPSRLTDEEYAEIKKHPLHALEILKDHPEVPPGIAELAGKHHEYLDGTGYPMGLEEKDINFLVRVLTICDIYAALTEQRSYKESYGPRQAFAIMMEMKGKLDMDLLAKFRPVIFNVDVGTLKRNRRGDFRTQPQGRLSA